jgi:hypothetical protein
LRQSRGLISQDRDWAFNIIGDCPSNKGRCYILQKKTKSWSVKRGMIEKEGNKYITSEVGWKSGISSRQRGCTGTLKMSSWSSFHQGVKEGWVTVIGTKGLGA